MNHDFLFLTRDSDALSQQSLARFKLSGEALASISDKLEQIKWRSKQNMMLRQKNGPEPSEKEPNIEYNLVLKGENEVKVVHLENKCYTSTPFVDSINPDNLENSSDKKCKVQVIMYSTPDNHEIKPLKMGSCRRYIRKMRPPAKKPKEIELFNPDNIISEEDIQAEIKKREEIKINMKQPFIITKVPRERPVVEVKEPEVTLLIEE